MPMPLLMTIEEEEDEAVEKAEEEGRGASGKEDDGRRGIIDEWAPPDFVKLLAEKLPSCCSCSVACISRLSSFFVVRRGLAIPSEVLALARPRAAALCSFDERCDAPCRFDCCADCSRQRCFLDFGRVEREEAAAYGRDC